jgi:hypothetical protein
MAKPGEEKGIFFTQFFKLLENKGPTSGGGGGALQVQHLSDCYTFCSRQDTDIPFLSHSHVHLLELYTECLENSGWA